MTDCSSLLNLHEYNPFIKTFFHFALKDESSFQVYCCASILLERQIMLVKDGKVLLFFSSRSQVTLFLCL